MTDTPISDDEDRRAWMDRMNEKERRDFPRKLTAEEREEFDRSWHHQARDEQLPPPEPWRIWLIMAGRGFGKTRAGAEWVLSIADADPHARIALVASSLAEARAVMVEGESGILACSPDKRLPDYEPSLRRITFNNGAQALLYSAAEPEALRGPQHSHACRAEFCGPGCTLSPTAFTREVSVIGSDPAGNRVDFGLPDNGDFQFGTIRWVDGPLVGLKSDVISADADGLVIGNDLIDPLPIGTRALIREGCDHLLSTCNTRFANAVNFQGEPYLPGNDLLAQYPKAP